MKKLLGAVALALLAQTANAQLAAEGLVIGLKRNEALAYIDKLSHGGARMVCSPDSDDRLRETCRSSAVTGLTIEGHAVKELYMEFLGKRLDLLEVTFADRDAEPALASLSAQMTKKLGQPPECSAEYDSCEWKRDGQVLTVGVLEAGDLTLVMIELEYDDQGIWGDENQEFDEMYPVRDRRPRSYPEELSMR